MPYAEKKKGSHRCQDEGMDLLILLDNRELDGQVLFTYMNNKLLQAKAAQEDQLLKSFSLRYGKRRGPQRVASSLQSFISYLYYLLSFLLSDIFNQ